ncbi:hypothetical protein ACWDS7_13505, partial [Streptosporangium sp. NPDC003464]
MSPEQVVLPYATWPSPISSTGVARSGLRLGFPTVLGGEVWWTEDRPAEGGRTTIVHRAADGVCRELLAAPWSARTRVHEYGGRSYAVVPGGGVVFANLTDQRLYLLLPGAEPRPITPVPGPLPITGSQQPGGHGTLQDRVQQALFKRPCDQGDEHPDLPHRG